MAIRMTGMISGLDTEALVSAMVSAYSVKKSSFVKKKTSAEWKKDAWKELNTKIKSLYNSVSSLRYTSAYSVKKASISDSTKATVKADNNAVSGTQKLEIKELASAGYLTGAKLTGSSANSTLADLGFGDANGKVSVEVEGKRTDIEVTSATTITEFVNKLKDAGVGANYDATNQRIYVSAKNSGVAADFSLTGTNQGGLNALGALGLSVNDSTASNETYKNLAKYADEAYVAYGDQIAAGTMTKDQAVVAHMKDVLKNISDKKDDNVTLESDNAKNNTQLKYVNAYKNASEKLESMSLDADAKAELTELLSQNDTSKYVYKDAEGKTFYVTGGEEEKDADGNVTGYKYTIMGKTTDEDGNEVDDPQPLVLDDKLQTVDERAKELAKNGGMVKDEDGEEVLDLESFGSLKNSLTAVRAFESDEANTEYTAKISAEYALRGAEGLASEADKLTADIDANKATIKSNNKYISDNKEVDFGDYSDAKAAELAEKISFAKKVDSGEVTMPTSAGAKRINGADAKIMLNEVEYTGSSNNFSINGLMITANALTTEPITVTTNDDTQGIYDKVKGFLKEYNTLMNEMTKLFNAPSSKGFEPLTDEEKDEMSDKEVEKWEQKIKDSLLRRDDTLNSVMNAMQSAMYKTYSINGRTLSLSTFGIKTIGVLQAPENEGNAYHIDGDSEDTLTSGKSDKLMKALQEDPESVVEFMKKLSEGLYNEMDKKMKSTALKSAYNVYNDKQMDKDIKNYSSLITKWEDKISDYEDRYYKQFAAMEKALATLQSQSSSLGSMMGMG